MFYLDLFGISIIALPYIKVLIKASLTSKSNFGVPLTSDSTSEPPLQSRLILGVPLYINPQSPPKHQSFLPIRVHPRHFSLHQSPIYIIYHISGLPLPCL